MPRMIITHAVEDVERWLGFKDERAAAVAGMGGTNVTDHAAHDGSNVVAVGADVEDPDAMMAALASPPPEVGATMAKHGVIPPLTAFVEK